MSTLNPDGSLRSTHTYLVAGSSFMFYMCSLFHIPHIFVCVLGRNLFLPEDYQQIFPPIVFWWRVLIYPSQHNGWVTILQHHHLQRNLHAVSVFFATALDVKLFLKITSVSVWDLSKPRLFLLQSNVPLKRISMSPRWDAIYNSITGPKTDLKATRVTYSPPNYNSCTKPWQ